MTFTTPQASKALCITPEALRKHRERRGFGHEIVPGKTGWTFDDLESIRRLSGRRDKRYSIKFDAKQMDGTLIPGRMIIWADYPEVAKSKADAWFWNALLKNNASKWGIPVKFSITSIGEKK